MYRIALHVGNVDLEDSTTTSRIAVADDLSDLAWEIVDGRLLAVLYCDDRDPIGRVVQVARRITHALPEASVDGIDQDLVSITDIAARAGVTREAVRLWVKGARGPADFPAAIGSVGGGERGSTQVWSWPTVNQWLEDHFGLGDGEKYLTPEQVAQATAALLKVEDRVDHEWKEIVQLDFPVLVDGQSDRSSSRHRGVTVDSPGDFVSAVKLWIGREA